MAIAQAPPIPRRLTDLTLEFLATLELERGLSRNTLEAYRSDLQQFGLFLGRRGRDPLEVAPADLSAFISELADGRDGKRPVAPATLQRKIACLRSFYRHLRREQIMGDDPTAELRPPRSTGSSPSPAGPPRRRSAIGRCWRRCTPAGCGRRRRSRSS
jgi:integrase/recombinase XerD